MHLVQSTTSLAQKHQFFLAVLPSCSWYCGARQWGDLRGMREAGSMVCGGSAREICPHQAAEAKAWLRHTLCDFRQGPHPHSLGFHTHDLSGLRALRTALDTAQTRTAYT